MNEEESQLPLETRVRLAFADREREQRFTKRVGREVDLNAICLLVTRWDLDNPDGREAFLLLFKEEKVRLEQECEKLHKELMKEILGPFATFGPFVTIVNFLLKRIKINK